MKKKIHVTTNRNILFNDIQTTLRMILAKKKITVKMNIKNVKDKK